MIKPYILNCNGFLVVFNDFSHGYLNYAVLPAASKHSSSPSRARRSIIFRLLERSIQNKRIPNLRSEKTKT